MPGFGISQVRWDWHRLPQRWYHFQHVPKRGASFHTTFYTCLADSFWKRGSMADQSRVQHGWSAILLTFWCPRRSRGYGWNGHKNSYSVIRIFSSILQQRRVSLNKAAYCVWLQVGLFIWISFYTYCCKQWCDIWSICRRLWVIGGFVHMEATAALYHPLQYVW